MYVPVSVGEDSSTSSVSSLLYMYISVNVGEDCPVFDGMYEFCQLSTGGSVGMLNLDTIDWHAQS